jgi:prevent-host-death family protein
MKAISIRDLHMHTGKWVRHAATGHEPLLILDRGRPTARLMPIGNVEPTPFHARISVPGFNQLPPVKADSGQFLEEERR